MPRFQTSLYLLADFSEQKGCNRSPARQARLLGFDGAMLLLFIDDRGRKR